MAPKHPIPKQYADQKIRVMIAYKATVNIDGADDTWVKVDVRQCRAEEPMQFTVQVKKANSQDGRWKTVGKVDVIAPSIWGRWNGNQKDSFLKASFERFL